MAKSKEPADRSQETRVQMINSGWKPLACPVFERLLDLRRVGPEMTATNLRHKRP